MVHFQQVSWSKIIVALKQVNFKFDISKFLLKPFVGLSDTLINKPLDVIIGEAFDSLRAVNVVGCPLSHMP